MSKYVYPAIFTPEEAGISVEFPDVTGCFSSGETLAEAMDMATDALCLMLYHLETEGKRSPSVSKVKDVPIEGDQFVSLISCDTITYRKRFDNRAVKKTLTIPAWLNDMAERDGVNFSATLQGALKNQLHIE